jgi:hypothetical protein
VQCKLFNQFNYYYSIRLFTFFEKVKEARQAVTNATAEAPPTSSAAAVVAVAAVASGDDMKKLPLPVEDGEKPIASGGASRPRRSASLDSRRSEKEARFVYCF